MEDTTPTKQIENDDPGWRTCPVSAGLGHYCSYFDRNYNVTRRALREATFFYFADYCNRWHVSILCPWLISKFYEYTKRNARYLRLLNDYHKYRHHGCVCNLFAARRPDYVFHFKRVCELPNRYRGTLGNIPKNLHLWISAVAGAKQVKGE